MNISIPLSTKGRFACKDTEDIERIYWFERLSIGEKNNEIIILIGIPTQEIYSEISRTLITSLSTIVFLALLCFFMAWFFGKKAILDPINHLVIRIRRIQKGDLSPSSETVTPPGELRMVAEALNDMSRNLSQKEMEKNEAIAALKNEITGHKETVKALREREEHLRILFEEAADAVYVAKPDGSLVKANKQACRALGYTEGEILNLNVIDIDADIPSSGALFEISQRISQENPITIDTMHRRKNGTTLPVEITMSLLQTREGPQVLAIARDITERRKAEAERENLQAQLQQAQKMEYIGRLAGGIAHDYNNVIGIIIGFSELALDKVGPQDPLRNDLKEIYAAAERSKGITRQLLAFARKDIIEPKVIDPNSGVESMLTILRRLIGEDIDLVWDPGKNVWPILMDPSQFSQIIANLCINARDAIIDVGKIIIETANVTLDPAGCAVHAEHSPGEFVRLSVNDDGCGIDPAILDKIFEPFFTTKEVGRGTGLGLATAYGIVQQNNGFIKVHSEPGKGATFQIYIPKHGEDITEKHRQHFKAPPQGKGETVLVVEDETSILKLAKQILSKYHYQVLAANSPFEALELAKAYAGHIALLITDVVMPKMNGHELAQQLKSFHPDMKCMYMSGYTTDLIAHRGVLDEGVQFIQKPFTPYDFVIKIRSVLDQSI